MRFVFHLARPGDVSLEQARYAPRSLEAEGFVHASHRGEVEASAALYFAGQTPALWVIDPRRLDVPLRLEDTPRGPMPHIFGSVPTDAMREIPLASVQAHADDVRGGRILFVAFAGMTLLDLVGVLDPVSRIASMGFDPALSCEVAAASDERVVFRAAGVEMTAAHVRPDLADFDAVVVPGGLAARDLYRDPAVVAWLRGFPANRLMASVCTGALLVGAAGRLEGKRATTHHSELSRLAELGATAAPGARVVDEGQVITAGGVTCALDLGLHLVERLAGADCRARIARQMEIAS